MKLLFLIVVALIIAVATYLFSIFRINQNNKTKKSKKFSWIPFKTALVIFTVLLCIIAYGVYSTAHQPDIQCSSLHATTSMPSKSLKTATDYFTQGNYEYDIGSCQQALV